MGVLGVVVSTSAGRADMCVVTDPHEGTHRMAGQAMTATEIAGLFEALSLANARVAEALDQMVARPYPASAATVIELERVLERIRPAAAMRERLATLSSDDLLAGAAVWDQRRRTIRPVPDQVEESA